MQGKRCRRIWEAAFLEGKFFWVCAFLLPMRIRCRPFIWLQLPGAITQELAEGIWYDITVLCLLGVLLPDTGLRDPEVSSSSADDQEDRS